MKSTALILAHLRRRVSVLLEIERMLATIRFGRVNISQQNARHGKMVTETL